MRNKHKITNPQPLFVNRLCEVQGQTHSGMEKGILGVRKDPKKPMLFSFITKKGEEWPSDDSDADYVPTFEEENDDLSSNEVCKKRRKTSQRLSTSENEERHPPIKMTIKKQRISEGEETVYVSDSTVSRRYEDSPWAMNIPMEILQKIFLHIIDIEGFLPFLSRVPKVCRLWWETSHLPSLWHDIDFAAGNAKATNVNLKWLCHNRIQNVRKLSLAGCVNITDEGLQCIADNCPRLESINLSRCNKLSGDSIQNLIMKCNKIDSIDLSYLQPKAVANNYLIDIIRRQGPQLHYLNFSGNRLCKFTSCLTEVATNCPNLHTLEICNAHDFSSPFTILPVESLQQGCQKLEVLRIANSRFKPCKAMYAEQAVSPGFPNLKELSVALDPGSGNLGVKVVDDEFLHRLVKTSRNLQLLDLRGSSHLTSQGIQALTIDNLQHLYLSHSSVAKYDGIAIILYKWRHSLIEIDLSWNLYPAMSLDLAIQKLCETPASSKLEVIDFSGTCISASRVESLLQGCPRMRSLNLVSCRGLPRGMKKHYKEQELLDLRNNIHEIVKTEEFIPNCL